MTTAKTLVIQADGTHEIRDVPTGYPAFNQAVLDGGYTQAMYVQFPGMNTLLVFNMDEEGKFKHLPTNWVGTELWYQCGGAQLMPGDMFCGTVAVNAIENAELADVPDLSIPLREAAKRLGGERDG